MKATLLIVAALFVGACTAAPAPTPEVIVKTIEVPGPKVEVPVPGPTVYTVPQVCYDAIDGLVEALDSENDLLGFYFEGKEPTEEAFDRFLDGDPEALFKMVSDCYGYQPSGISG